MAGDSETIEVEILYRFPAYVIGTNFEHVDEAAGELVMGANALFNKVGTGDPNQSALALFTDKAGVLEWHDTFNLTDGKIIPLERPVVLVELLEEYRCQFTHVAVDPAPKRAPKFLSPIDDFIHAMKHIGPPD